MESAVAPVRSRARLAAFSVSTTVALTSLVGASALIRFLLGLRRETILYLPDEYTYSALARGIATTGRPEIRGVVAHFPALLEPLLAAPFSLTGNPELAFRLTQAMQAVVMSLAAIPVYLLCQRLALGRNLALGAALLALVSPNLLYASYSVADPIAYPLVLSALYAGLVVLDSHSRKAQVAFVGLAVLSAFARIQYLLLVPVLLVAAVIAERGNVRRAGQRVGLAATLFAGGAAISLAAGTGRVLGVYGSVVHLHASASVLYHTLHTHLLLLPFSAGILLVPGALVGLSRGLFRSDSATERGFAALTALFGLGLVGQSVFVAATISGNYGERYLICLFPLLAPAFGLYARRGGATKIVWVISAGLALLAMRVTLSGLAAGKWKTDSTFLVAFARLEQATSTGSGALIASLVALLLAFAAAYVAVRPGARVRIAIGLAVLAQCAVAAGATSWDAQATRIERQTILPADPRWVDHARLGHVELLEAPGGNSGNADETLFWNTSLTRVDLLESAAPTDAYGGPLVKIGADGTMFADGSALAGPLLVDQLRTWTSFSGVRLAGKEKQYRLLAPAGTPRLVAEAIGVRSDGWLASSGAITIWPRPTSSRLTLRLSLPRTAQPDSIHFLLAGGATRSVTVAPGHPRIVTFVLPARVRSVIRFNCDRYTIMPDGQPVSFRTVPPTLTPVGARARP